jgi:putative ABC transport system ATP-binding protein
MTLTLTRNHKTGIFERDLSVAARAVDATKLYGKGEAEVRALDGINVEFRTSKFTAIMGPSGSGKSTLMHAMAGLDSLTSGSVWVGDVELGKLNDKKLTKLRRDRIGFIFQAFNLIPTLSAAENILLPMKLAGRKPDAAWFDNVVATVGLGNRLSHRPSELSGGQQQRVAVARALVNQLGISTLVRVPRFSPSCVRPRASSVKPS